MSTTLAPRREPPEAPADLSSRRLTERVFRVRETGIIAVLALFVLITAIIQPRFVSSSNIQFILVDTSVYALVALGETMVIISRNVDLSVQSVLALSAYLSAGLFGHVHGIPIPVVFLVGFGIGVAFGAANGLMVSLGRVPSLVVTLATLYIIQGIDIATKAEVHRLLSQLAGNGVAILMISSELPEVLRVGDRILVMREGRLTAEYPHDEATEEKIMAAATGQTQARAS